MGDDAKYNKCALASAHQSTVGYDLQSTDFNMKTITMFCFI